MNIVRHIPNTITSMNLLCGSLGVIFTLQNRFDIAFYLMLAAAVCDFFDGFAARLLKAYSDIGKELDSLADMVSFGLLPSLMSYRAMEIAYGESLLCYIPLIIAVFSALRLAKFNLDERQSDNFIGLPTPACAMLCGSFVYYLTMESEGIIHTLASTAYFIPTSSIVLALLLICEIPMFSMKFKKNMKSDVVMFRLRILFAVTLIASSVLTCILGLNWSFIVILTFTAYIMLNVISHVIHRQQR